MLLIATLLAICGPGPRVNCIVDGDTFWLAGEKIRIENIDTPEISEPKCPAERAAGERAKVRLQQLLSDGEIAIQRTGVDRYKRTLAVVRVNGRDVGEVLIREGFARRWDGARRPWC